MEEGRAVGFGEGGRAANVFRADACAQICHDGAGGKGCADGVFSERTPARAEHNRASLQATISQRNIGGNRDAVWCGLFGDIIIGGVETVADEFEGKQRMVWHAYPAIGDEQDGHIVAHGDLINFILNRTGIAIDQYLRGLRRCFAHCVTLAESGYIGSVIEAEAKNIL